MNSSKFYKENFVIVSIKVLLVFSTFKFIELFVIASGWPTIGYWLNILTYLILFYISIRLNLS